jgi:PhnB protein
MTQDVDPIPEDYGALIIQLVLSDATAAIEFYKRAFGATDLYRQHDPSGTKIVHCELVIGHSRLILYDEFPERGLISPATLGGTPVSLMLYVEDVDDSVRRARDLGAHIISEPETKFWGVRSSLLLDPFGHRWLFASRVEDLSPADILERACVAPASARMPQGGPIRSSDG